MRSSLESTKLILEHLKNCLNLSEYEARVYEFLVRSGPSTARIISVSCGIPRTKVYEVLRKLIERNMVFEASLNPKIFIASPPAEVFKHFLILHEIIAKDFHTITLNLQKIYEESMGLAGVSHEEIWLFTGDEALERILNLLSSAEKSIEILSPWNVFLNFYGVSKEALEELFKKGVKIKLYVPSGSKIDRRYYFSTDICFKVVKRSPLAMVLFIDDKHAIIRFINDEKDFLQGGEWILIAGKKTPIILKKALFQETCSVLSE